MPERPHITVAAVIEREGRFLMVEEKIDGETVYNQPAGHLENAEGLLQAVIRETLEETAWHFCPEHLVGIYRWTRPGDGPSYLRACFSGHCTHQETGRALDQGIERALWLNLAEIRQRSRQLRSPMVIECITDYLDGRRFPLSLLNDIDDQ